MTEEEQNLLTVNNLLEIGLNEWTHPKTEQKRYYFNAKKYSDCGDGDDRIISRSKDGVLINSKVFFDNNLNLVIQNRTQEYLNRDKAKIDVMNYVLDLIKKEKGDQNV